VSFWIVRDELHVLSLATAPEHRRRGHGEALLTAALEHARAKGARRASLEVRSDNDAACDLYRKLGFEPVGELRGFFRRGP